MTLCTLVEGIEWITMYRTTLCHVLENLNIYHHHFENFRSPISHISSHRGVWNCFLKIRLLPGINELKSQYQFANVEILLIFTFFFYLHQIIHVRDNLVSGLCPSCGMPRATQGYGHRYPISELLFRNIPDDGQSPETR